MAVGCRGPDDRIELASPAAQTQPAPSPASRPAPASRRPALAGRTVLVDAGHGGPDPGAWEYTLSALPEKTIALDIARETARILQREGARAYLTRDGDERVDLRVRAEAGARLRADLLLSIHANAAPNSQAAGAEIYICRGALPQSEQAAAHMENALRRWGIACRGIRRRDFVVLAGHPRPAILVECGFLTNREDARRLNDAAWRRRLAAVLADGVIRCLGR